jgi:hypothetical protein
MAYLAKDLSLDNEWSCAEGGSKKISPIQKSTASWSLALALLLFVGLLRFLVPT